MPLILKDEYENLIERVGHWVSATAFQSMAKGCLANIIDFYSSSKTNPKQLPE